MKTSVPLKPILLPSDDEKTNKQYQINKLGLTIDVKKDRNFDFEKAFQNEDFDQLNDSQKLKKQNNNHIRKIDENNSFISNQTGDLNCSISDSNHDITIQNNSFSSNIISKKNKKLNTLNAATLTPFQPIHSTQTRRRSTGNVKKDLEKIYQMKLSKKKENLNNYGNQKNQKRNELSVKYRNIEKKKVQSKINSYESENEEKNEKNEEFQKLIDKYNNSSNLDRNKINNDQNQTIQSYSLKKDVVNTIKKPMKSRTSKIIQNYNQLSEKKSNSSCIESFHSASQIDSVSDIMDLKANKVSHLEENLLSKASEFSDSNVSEMQLFNKNFKQKTEKFKHRKKKHFFIEKGLKLKMNNQFKSKYNNNKIKKIFQNYIEEIEETHKKVMKKKIKEFKKIISELQDIQNYQIKYLQKNN